MIINAGKLFDVVLVKLMLRGHILRLLSHLVQEVPSLALDKSYNHHEVKQLSHESAFSISSYPMSLFAALKT